MTTEDRTPSNTDTRTDFCMNCCTFLDNLIQWEPAFYSDWTLVQHCTSRIHFDHEHNHLTCPDIAPTPEIQQLIETAAHLNLQHDKDDQARTTITEAVRAIVSLTPGSPMLQQRHQYLDVKVYPFAIPVVKLDRNYYAANPIFAFGDLCVALARELLQDGALLAVAPSVFCRQLEKLANYSPGPSPPLSLPTILSESSILPRPSEYYYEKIQHELVYFHIYPIREWPLITFTIRILAHVLQPSPPFPNLFDKLERYYRRKIPKDCVVRSRSVSEGGMPSRQFASKITVLIPEPPTPLVIPLSKFLYMSVAQTSPTCEWVLPEIPAVNGDIPKENDDQQQTPIPPQPTAETSEFPPPASQPPIATPQSAPNPLPDPARAADARVNLALDSAPSADTRKPTRCDKLRIRRKLLWPEDNMPVSSNDD